MRRRPRVDPCSERWLYLTADLSISGKMCHRCTGTAAAGCNFVICLSGLRSYVRVFISQSRLHKLSSSSVTTFLLMSRCYLNLLVYGETHLQRRRCSSWGQLQLLLFVTYCDTYVCKLYRVKRRGGGLLEGPVQPFGRCHLYY